MPYLAEERQDQNAKRRKLDKENSRNAGVVRPSASLALTAPPIAPFTSPSTASVHPSLPQRPAYDFAANADSIGFGAPLTAQSVLNAPTAAQALAGSNRDVVANRRAIRMANMSAAEMLKAELAGLTPVKPDLALPSKPAPPSNVNTVPHANVPAPVSNASDMSGNDSQAEFESVPGFGNYSSMLSTANAQIDVPMKVDQETPDVEADAEGDIDPDVLPANGHSNGDVPVVGTKRKLGEDQDDDVDVEAEVDTTMADDEDEAPPDASALALKVNADGTVEQEDTVKYVSCFRVSHRADQVIAQAMGARIQGAILPTEVWCGVERH